MLLSVPTELGWQRTTWTREVLGRELERRCLPRVAACTVGRALEDEMDVHLNPIGRDWMPRGHRRYVRTPGQNEKRSNSSTGSS